MNEKLTVKVSGGYLVAKKSTDPDYPGIDIDFIPDNCDESCVNPRVLIECITETEEIRALIWNNTKSEDYTHEVTLRESKTMKRANAAYNVAKQIYEDEKLELEDIHTIENFLINSEIEEDNFGDFHMEFSEDDLFDWLCEGIESPSEIRRMKLPSEMSNVLEVRNRWIYWEE